MGKLLREPLLHFLLLGALLYLLRPVLPAWAPFAPVSGTIHVTAADHARLGNSWRRETGRLPSDTEHLALLERHIDNEILLRHALRLRLQHNDAVVRRRLINNLRFLQPDSAKTDSELFSRAIALQMEKSDLVTRRRLIQLITHRIHSQVRVTEQDLENHYAQHADRFSQPDRFSFSQVFFSADSRGASAQEQARQALKQLRANPDTQPLPGDPFLHGQRFSGLDTTRIAEIFSPQTATEITAASPGVWTGPVQSPYGLHLFRVDQVHPGGQLDYKEVRPRLIAEVYRRREQAYLNAWLRMQRKRYRIIIDETAGA